jgi:hypothetical protein
VTRIGELGTLAVTSNRHTLRRNDDGGARLIPEDSIVHSHLLENLKSYIAKLVFCLANVLTLKMEGAGSSEMLVDFQQTTGHYIPEDRTFQWGISI